MPPQGEKKPQNPQALKHFCCIEIVKWLPQKWHCSIIHCSLCHLIVTLS